MELIHAFGVVQGVGFRPFVWGLATSLGLNGYVQNKGSYVEIVLEGDTQSIEEFSRGLRTSIPPHARIDSIMRKSAADRGYASFSIVRSEADPAGAASGIPPDLAICRSCRKELFSEGDRRHLYPFINCTACGPRFTIINGVPYDRESTTMGDFEMCGQCAGEYGDPSDRRYHAEPIACRQCGPKYTLYSRKGALGGDPFIHAARIIDRGGIVAIKGYGGFHIACDATSKEAVNKLRRVLGRPDQPFAVMVKDVDAIRFELDAGDKEELFFPSAPIVLCDKLSKGKIADNIAPELAQVGVILPYAPAYLILFSHLKTPCIVMTSANYPGNPMITSLNEGMGMLLGVDHFLSHNLRISNRCDDSVLRNGMFIRRSRGYVPSFLHVPTAGTSVSFGAELNNVMACSAKGRCLLTQHIGDTSNWDVLEAGLEALKVSMGFSGIKKRDLEYILCDLHPSYHTSVVAREWATELDIPLFPVQHHFAHSYGLAGEHGLEEAICIAADGMGYGGDGSIWGGEVLHVTGKQSDSVRAGHLEQIPMPGGDLATKNPLRILIPLLEDSEFLPYLDAFGHDMDTVRSIREISKKNGPFTSSCGRLLDAVSAMTGACTLRTYEGEPAMKLEALANGGCDIGLRMELDGPVACTGDFLRQLNAKVPAYPARDIAYTAHIALAQAFIDIISYYGDIHAPVGFTGGVAVNELLGHAIGRRVEAMGRKFYVHRLVPPGDGGISYGQACMRM